MFLKGFGYDQCEEDVAKQPSNAKRMRPKGAILFGYNQCEKDVAKQLSNVTIPSPLLASKVQIL